MANMLWVAGIFALVSICFCSQAATAEDGGRNNSPAITELLQNGSFEQADPDGLPSFWHVVSPGGRDCSMAHSGSCSLVIPGNTVVRRARQKITVSGIAGDLYSVGFWYFVSGDRIHQTVNVKVKWLCADGSTGGRIYQIFPRRPTDYWVQDGFGVMPSCDHTRITVMLWYASRGFGSGWFDDVSITTGSLTSTK